MKFALAISALALAAALGTSVSAASLTINSVKGVWQNDLPDPETSLHRVIIDALFWTTSTD